jgi:hypothetical protein
MEAQQTDFTHTGEIAPSPPPSEVHPTHLECQSDNEFHSGQKRTDEEQDRNRRSLSSEEREIVRDKFYI